MSVYNAAADRLRILAPRKGVRVPPMIELGGWFTVPITASAAVPASSSSSSSSPPPSPAVVAASNDSYDYDHDNDGDEGGFLSQSLGDAKVRASKHRHSGTRRYPLISSCPCSCYHLCPCPCHYPYFSPCPCPFLYSLTFLLPLSLSFLLS